MAIYEVATNFIPFYRMKIPRHREVEYLELACNVELGSHCNGKLETEVSSVSWNIFL